MTHPALVPPLAIERYRILEPHLADNIPLADLARTGTVSERTLQRWLARYRSEGLAGLARLPRNDRGKLHLPEHLVELTRNLAIKRPRPPVAAIHRKVGELAVAEGRRAPSYSAIARIVRAVPSRQIAVTSDPAQLDEIEAQAAVIRITRGNFRLVERLFAQMRRIMTLNRVDTVSPDIVQAARDCLVIGPGN